MGHGVVALATATCASACAYTTPACPNFAARYATQCARGLVAVNAADLQLHWQYVRRSHAAAVSAVAAALVAVNAADLQLH